MDVQSCQLNVSLLKDENHLPGFWTYSSANNLQNPQLKLVSPLLCQSFLHILFGQLRGINVSLLQFEKLLKLPL